MQTNIPLKEIIEFLGSDIKTIYGNPEGIVVNKLSDPQNVDETTLDWISDRREDKQTLAENSKAKAIVVTSDVKYSESLKHQGKVLIAVGNPKMAIAKVGNHFFIEKPKPGIHPTAILHPEAEIGENVTIGPYCVIGKCRIGNNSVLDANVVLYENTTIGNNVRIHSGAIIGTDGLGCEREPDGTLVKFPHLGGVIIEDNVDIGSSCQIAKGALSNTIIGKGSKLNVGCFIAHNTTIGKNAWISPKVNIAGSCRILNNVTIFSGVVIREQTTIGSHSVIGMGTVVLKNVPEGETWVGNPAKKLSK
ncbi:MAG: DapH/DapD/GlmU-related protein [Bacteroidales bacterium]|nr:DapH/DapD/GlmU-related protein [Bacteroidales bacterium]